MIKHGLAARPGAGTVEIRATRDGQHLRLVVRDDGAGLPESWRAEDAGNGIGLTNTRRRLEQLYDGQSSFELHNQSEGGLEVSLAIPYRVQEGAPPRESKGGRGRARDG